MKLSQTARLKRNSKKVFKTIQGTTYILDDENDAICTLNPTASFIWKKIKQAISFSNLTQAIAKEYGISQKRAEKDLREILKQFEKHNLISTK